MINFFSFLRIIHSLCINLNKITVQLDEVLLWKLVDFFDVEIPSLNLLLFQVLGLGFRNSSNIEHKIDLNINDYATDRLLSSTQAIRIYFNKLYISPVNVNLSVYTISSKKSLSMRLLEVKHRASLPIIPFENAEINLKAYERTHISNAHDFFLLSITMHYVSVCRPQLFKIIGSTDFLGNPRGLVRDLTDGVTCLVDKRGVGGFVKNIRHGVGDSASKVTRSISKGVRRFVADDEYEDERRTTVDRHRSAISRQSVHHERTGLFAGSTSIMKQACKDAVEKGAPKLVKSFAKNIVVKVSTPIINILDFTNDMAIFIKDGSHSSSTFLENRIRPTRCPSNSLGLLQSYSFFDAQGHYLLYKINEGNMSERYISRITLCTTQTVPSDKQVISTDNLQNQLCISEQKNISVDVSSVHLNHYFVI